MTAIPAPLAVQPRTPFSPNDLVEISLGFEGADPTDVVRWAVKAFGPNLCATTSFSDTLLIDTATRVDPDIEVVFLDTGFHFAETLATMRKAMVRYHLRLTVLRPPTASPDVWSDGVAPCCGGRKVDLLNRHLLSKADAWLSGLRRDDSSDRASTPVVEFDSRGLVKINPLVVWSRAQLEDYVRTNRVLINPLRAQGYESIGCWPCTKPSTGDDPRSGRWVNSDRTECGLHDRGRRS